MQVRTDSHIGGRAKLTHQVESVVQHALDENSSQKFGTVFECDKLLTIDCPTFSPQTSGRAFHSISRRE